MLSLPDDGGTPDVGDMPEAIYGADGAALGRVFPTELLVGPATMAMALDLLGYYIGSGA